MPRHILTTAIARKVSAMAAMLAIALLGGCGKASQEAQVPDTVTSATMDLLSQPPEIDQATTLVAAQCLRAKGFDIPTSLSVPMHPQGYGDIGGVFRSRSEAVSVGYPNSTVDYSKGMNQIDAYRKTLNKTQQRRFETMLNGDSGDGDSDEVLEVSTACYPTAYRAVYGSWKNYSRLSDTSNEYTAAKTETTLRDRDVQRAINDTYVPCMKQAGYKVRGLRAGEIAKQRFGTYRSWNEPPNAAEQQLALQDYTCQSKAKLMDTVNAALEKTAGKWMLENEASLLERHELLEEAMQRAKQVINGEITYDTYMNESGGAKG